jgi:hypothetical protein
MTLENLEDDAASTARRASPRRAPRPDLTILTSVAALIQNATDTTLEDAGQPEHDTWELRLVDRMSRLVEALGGLLGSVVRAAALLPVLAVLVLLTTLPVLATLHGLGLAGTVHLGTHDLSTSGWIISSGTSALSLTGFAAWLLHRHARQPASTSHPGRHRLYTSPR